MTTTPPGGTPAPRGRRLARLGPTALSAVAVLISVVALVVAVLAYARGNGDSTRAVRPAAETTTATPSAAGTTAPAAATTDPVSEAEPTAGDELSGTDAPLPSGGAPYAVVKQDVRVTLAGGAGVQRTIDLDQPLVNADSTRTDVTYSTYHDPAQFEFGTEKVAQARSRDVTPDECASSIQLSPADREVELSQDLVLCTVTNGVGAVNEPSRPKMARIVVNSVGPDKTATLTITTWEIPR
jgi:hypothetical protein